MDWWVNLIATVAPPLIASVGLFATAWSVKLQARSNDLNSLFQITNQLREAEARLMGYRAELHRHDVEVVNYLNLMETFAIAVNGKLFGKATRKIAEDRLVNDIAILMANESSRSRIEAAITSDSTFRELGRFSKGHRQPIRHVTETMQNM